MVRFHKLMSCLRESKLIVAMASTELSSRPRLYRANLNFSALIGDIGLTGILNQRKWFWLERYWVCYQGYYICRRRAPFFQYLRRIEFLSWFICLEIDRLCWRLWTCRWRVCYRTCVWPWMYIFCQWSRQVRCARKYRVSSCVMFFSLRYQLIKAKICQVQTSKAQSNILIFMGSEAPKSVVYATEKISDTSRQTGAFRASWDCGILQRSPSVGINNLQQLWHQSLRKFSSRPLFGKIIEKESQSLMCKTNVQHDVQYVSYSEIDTKANQVGSGIKNLSLAPENKKGISPVYIFAGNSQQWMLVDLASALFGLTVVTIYQSLGLESIPYILNQTEGKTLFCKSKQYETLSKLTDFGKLQNIVLLDNSPVKPIDKIKILKLSEVIEAGKVLVKQPQIPPQKTFTICYTSGTTGMPKGAQLTHSNLLALVTSVHSVKGIFGQQPQTFISYLPLPHIFERGIMYNTISMGFKTTFFRGSAQKLLQDIQIVKPSIFVGVPRVFNKFYTKIMQGLNSVTGISKSIADSALQSKLQKINEDGSHKSFFYDTLVFNKIKNTFGGNIRLCITGSAPIEQHVLKFLKMALVCDFIEVYGSTQSCGCFFATDLKDPVLGHVGGPTATCEYKLVDVPDMGYTSKDEINNQRTPRGQVLIRGPGVFQGYYNQPQKTKQALDPEGWLQTGDIGMILPHNKALKIIDRKKNLFKLAQGQYISPEKVENIYLSQGTMNQAFVHGDSLQMFAVLLAFVDDIQLSHFIKKNGLTGEPSELRNTKQFRLKYLQSLNSASKKSSSINSIQLCKNVILLDKSFADRKCLTVTMKLKRHQARKAYQSEINQLYKQGNII